MTHHPIIKPIPIHLQYIFNRFIRQSESFIPLISKAVVCQQMLHQITTIGQGKKYKTVSGVISYRLYLYNMQYYTSPILLYFHCR